MDTEDIEKHEANTAEAEDESPGVIDEEMDAKDDGEEERMAEEERTEGMEGSEKQDEGESPKVSGYQVLSLTRCAVSDEMSWNRNNRSFTRDTSSYLYNLKWPQKCGRTGVCFENNFFFYFVFS